jgi:chaperone required for assembly of F1-ATPase
MPLTGLANAAIDRAAPDARRFAADLARYAEGDLLCYRSDSPESLIERQAAAWDPLLQWARRRFDIDFVLGTGVIHIAQPDATVARLRQEVAALDPWRMAALSPLVTIGGSLVVALAVVEDAVPVDQAWAAVSLDDAWQLEKWGADSLAEAALDSRRRDFLAAARFLDLLN